MIREHKDGVTIAVRAQPGAKRTKVVGVHGDELKIAVQAPPIEGRANGALIAFLSETLGVAKSKITLLNGELSRSKVFLVRGVNLEIARTALNLK
jgi:uncharacterized protein (TIGR00251 family)